MEGHVLVMSKAPPRTSCMRVRAQASRASAAPSPCTCRSPLRDGLCPISSFGLEIAHVQEEGTCVCAGWQHSSHLPVPSRIRNVQVAFPHASESDRDSVALLQSTQLHALESQTHRVHEHRAPRSNLSLALHAWTIHLLLLIARVCLSTRLCPRI